jgi:hypothetical protein
VECPPEKWADVMEKNTWIRGFIYSTSGASKVSPLYGKSRVKIDLRDRETRSA